MNDYKVSISWREDRGNFLLRYRDPVSRKVKSKTATLDDVPVTKRKDADRAAALWEKELREDGPAVRDRITWSEFADIYMTQRMAGLAKGSGDNFVTLANHLERLIAPHQLTSITSPVVNDFAAKLRTEGMRPTTLASNLKVLQAALRWAVRQGYLRKAPQIEMPPDADNRSRGRPLVLEEFERLLEQARAHKKGDRLERLLRGLWHSGFRLGEALGLSWDADAAISVRMDQHAVRFVAHAHKGRRDVLWPMPPDFEELLASVPAEKRRGLVFPTGLTKEHLTVMIGKLGEAAHIRTGVERRRRTDKATGKRQVVDVVKFATAHDLRRSFGSRWARHLMPAELQQLMRHTKIETTMRYYVDIPAEGVREKMLATIRPESNQTSNQAPVTA